MPCQKFISIRFQPLQETHVYVDDMTKPKLTLKGSQRFRLESPFANHTSKGTTVLVDAMRWPPEGYNSTIAISLCARWPYGTAHCEQNDQSGGSPGRSFTGVNFVYDEATKKLSWNQDKDGEPGKFQGSVEFYKATPVWYVTLLLDPGAPDSRGRLIVDKLGSGDVS